MSVETGLADANVLVYALDTQAQQYATARALLDEARAGAHSTLYVTSQILSEFYSVVTNPRKVMAARSSEDAVAAITTLLSFLHVLPMPAQVVDGWLDLLRRRPVIGADVFDLQIVGVNAGERSLSDLHI
jgi:predicted nucleic acid-binding protein